MSLNLGQVFSSAVDQSLKEWKSFQLCVEQGMGGQYTAEKLVWMTDTIVDFFTNNKDLELDEVIDFVSEIIDNEFDTIIEDGSLDIFATNVCKYYQLCSSGRLQEVVDKLTEIRDRNERLGVCASQANDNQTSVESQMKSLNITNGSEEQSQTSQVPQDMEEDDGWTRVQRKHRK